MFKRLAIAAVSTAVVGTGLVTTAPAADAATGIYKNCTTLHKKFKHGVGRNNAVDHTSGKPVTNFTHNTKQYKIAINKKRDLDRDRDGIACEKA